jgi:high affinity Mn2+ porin
MFFFNRRSICGAAVGPCRAHVLGALLGGLAGIFLATPLAVAQQTPQQSAASAARDDLATGPEARRGESATPGPDTYWPQLVGAQYTWIRQFQSSLHSPYSGTNSLNPNGDVAATHTVGIYFGWAITDTLQAYFDVEKFMGAGVSNAVGLGGLTNGDVVREGAAGLHKTPYVARRYLRYLVPLSGEVAHVERAQDQVAGREATTRLEFKLGTMGATDDFDKNRYSNSTRTQFMNWSLWNTGAWDYAADTRGYTNGVVAAYVSPAWSLRAGIYQMPALANHQDLDAPPSKARGENVEFDWSPAGVATVVRLLAYRNIARMGVYQNALAAVAATRTVPDIVADDRDGRKKYGLALNLEQPLADDGETGLFLRVGWNDGRTETFAFTEIDRTLALGGQIAGRRWGRARDRFGAAFVANGLSPDHRQYLAAGGLGFLLGDGQLNYAPEQIAEVFYRAELYRYRDISVQLSPDFQLIRNPAMNADRGPVWVASFRLHVEY